VIARQVASGGEALRLHDLHDHVAHHGRPGDVDRVRLAWSGYRQVVGSRALGSVGRTVPTSSRRQALLGSGGSRRRSDK
jgi:hypothetical protein